MSRCTEAKAWPSGLLLYNGGASGSLLVMGNMYWSGRPCKEVAAAAEISWRSGNLPPYTTEQRRPKKGGHRWEASALFKPARGTPSMNDPQAKSAQEFRPYLVSGTKAKVRGVPEQHGQLSKEERRWGARCAAVDDFQPPPRKDTMPLLTIDISLLNNSTSQYLSTATGTFNKSGSLPAAAPLTFAITRTLSNTRR